MALAGHRTALDLVAAVVPPLDDHGLDDHDLVDGRHLAVRAIDSLDLLDAVIEHSDEAASSGHGYRTCDGGLVLVVDGVPVLSPMCCVNLDDGISDWIDVVRHAPPEWTMVWTGHPWPLVRVVDGQIQITTPADDSHDLDHPTVVPFDLVGPALDRALADRALFASRLEARMRQRNHPHPEAAAVIAGVVEG